MSHTGFRLVPTSMTLNELNITGVPVMALILRYSPNSLALEADYVTLKIDL